MARGWESKAVEGQQDEAARGQTRAPGRTMTAAERTSAERRRTLELARTRAMAELQTATHPAHRQMLQQTLDAIAAELSATTPERS